MPSVNDPIPIAPTPSNRGRGRGRGRASINGGRGIGRGISRIGRLSTGATAAVADDGTVTAEIELGGGVVDASAEQEQEGEQEGDGDKIDDSKLVDEADNDSDTNTDNGDNNDIEEKIESALDSEEALKSSSKKIKDSSSSSSSSASGADADADADTGVSMEICDDETAAVTDSVNDTGEPPVIAPTTPVIIERSHPLFGLWSGSFDVRGVNGKNFNHVFTVINLVTVILDITIVVIVTVIIIITVVIIAIPPISSLISLLLFHLISYHHCSTCSTLSFS